MKYTVCAESGGIPTEYCPEESRVSRTFMVIPDGESGGTDDTHYRMPGTCPIHTQAAVVIPEETTAESPEVPETTAPFIMRRHSSSSFEKFSSFEKSSCLSLIFHAFPYL